MQKNDRMLKFFRSFASGRYLTRTSDLHDVNVADNAQKTLENKGQTPQEANMHTKLRTRDLGQGRVEPDDLRAELLLIWRSLDHGRERHY